MGSSMSLKVKMFNRQAADPKSKPDEILKALGLQPKQKVVDLGAGGGYFALRFADVVHVLDPHDFGEGQGHLVLVLQVDGIWFIVKEIDLVLLLGR